MRLNQEGESVVVVPSVTVDRVNQNSGSLTQAYEGGSCSCCSCFASRGCGWCT
jgi:hypothetical protein